MRRLVTRSRMTSTTTGTRVLGHQLLGHPREPGPDLARLGHPERLAAEPIGHLDVVDAVAADPGALTLSEGQLPAVVQVESALRNADQAQVGVFTSTGYRAG